MVVRCCKLVFVFLIVALAFVSQRLVGAQESSVHPLPPDPATPFGPSNAQTIDGKLIPVGDFLPAARCQKCHTDTHTAWSESLHRNAAREPFYRESADILLKTRGIEFTRHCESCHTPVALFSGALTKEAPKQSAPFTAMDDEGISCSVCHSITGATTNGTGSYTIRRPALLAREDHTPVYEIHQQPITDEQILADIPGHKRAVMRPVLKSAEFCATCHKVDAPPALNGYKNIKGFSAYDEWQQSGASGESIHSFYPRAERADCRTCHMPKVESLNDKAGKRLQVSGVGFQGGGDSRPSNLTPDTSHLTPAPRFIASHRWLGANTATPLFYGQTAQVKATEKFLQANVLEVDIFALKQTSNGEMRAALTSDDKVDFRPGEEVIAEVVISNRQAAHSFPPEVRDLYEAWVEFEVLDAQGKTIFHSGEIKADGMLDESAHVYKTIILDEQGRTITRHQIWTTNIKAYDNSIGPGKSDVVRYRFQVPEGSSQRGSSLFAAGNSSQFAGKTVRRKTANRELSTANSLTANRELSTANFTLRAKVNYRRFNQEYTEYVLNRQKKSLQMPIVEMAKTVVGGQWLVDGKNSPTTDHRLPTTPLAKRWNDYGIGLLEQAQYGEASEAFRKAAEIDPANPNYLVNAAIAEYRTERFAPEREQLHKVEELLTRALTFPATAFGHPLSFARVRYWQAIVLRAQNQRPEAAAIFSQLANEYPRDREIQRQFGQTLYTTGNLLGARNAFEALLGIDPTDANAWQMLSPLYASEKRQSESDEAQNKYLLWRDDPRAETIAARFYAAHPEWAEARNNLKIYGAQSPSRPVLTGAQAVPEK